MNKVVDFIKIKKELRGILKRKKNNDVNINVTEEDKKIKIYINDYLVQELRADKEDDRELIEEIVNLLVEQIKIQWLLTENKNKILNCLDIFNDDGIEKDVSKRIEFTDEYIRKYGIPF